MRFFQGYRGKRVVCGHTATENLAGALSFTPGPARHVGRRTSSSSTPAAATWRLLTILELPRSAPTNRDDPRVVSRTPLLYADGADATLDRPGHVRAGSALVIWREQLAVIPGRREASSPSSIARRPRPRRPFPGTNVRQFDDARGNKKSKLDLGPRSSSGSRLVAIGSGSSPLRERFVIVDDAVTLREMRAFYNALRAVFAGELNLEGAVVDGADLLLFQRGNGVGAKNQTARVGAAACSARSGRDRMPDDARRHDLERSPRSRLRTPRAPTATIDLVPRLRGGLAGRHARRSPRARCPSVA